MLAYRTDHAGLATQRRAYPFRMGARRGVRHHADPATVKLGLRVNAYLSLGVS
jgi:hypothetical protein